MSHAAAAAAKKAPSVFQTWFRVEVIPIYAVLGVACGGAGKFLACLIFLVLVSHSFGRLFHLCSLFVSHLSHPSPLLRL